MSNDRKLTTRAISTSKQQAVKTEKNPRQSKVLKNCNDGGHSQRRIAFERELYYYLLDKLSILWRGDPKIIEYTSKVDLDHYCHMLRWDIDTAISVSMGQSPGKVKQYWYRFSPEFKQRYAQREALLTEAINYGRISHEVAKYKPYRFFSSIRPVIRPLGFVQWAKRQNWEFFFDIEELVIKHDQDNGIDFEHRCKELEQENRFLKQKISGEIQIDENPLGVRREKSYQKFIAGLLKLRYNNSPDLINASNIASTLAGADLPFDMISEDTIRTLLKPCKMLLGIYSKSDKDKIE